MLLFSILIVVLLVGGDVLTTVAERCPEVLLDKEVLPGPISFLKFHAPQINSTTYVRIIFAVVKTPVPTVFQSNDNGITWIDLLGDKNPAIFPSGTLDVIEIADGALPFSIYFVGSGGELWHLNNSKLNLRFAPPPPGAPRPPSSALSLPKGFSSVVPHPFFPGWVMGSATVPCPRYRISTCLKLLLSRDWGITWETMKNFQNSAYYSYVNPDILYVIEADYATTTTNRYLMVNISNHFSPLVTIDDVVSLKRSSGSSTVFISKLQNYVYSLWVSNDAGYTFNEIRFPATPAADIIGFSIISYSEGTLMCGVYRLDDDLGRIADIYISDSNSNSFDISLSMVAASPNIESTPAGGIAGIYLANAYVLSANNEYSLTTFITYNYGAEWFLLPTPTETVCTTVEGHYCNLNLFQEPPPLIPGKVYSTVKSKATAVGLIMGSGQVGTLNEDAPSQLYLSTDAGKSWSTISSDGNAQLFAYANRGDLIMRLATDAPTTFDYSTNYGTTWKTCDMEYPIQVTAIYSDLSLNNRAFIVVSTENSTVLHFDLSGALPADCEENDYEEFTLRDPTNNPCFLGEELKITRRKIQAACYIPPDYVNVKTTRVCGCQFSDYRCKLCYRRAPIQQNNIEAERNCEWFCGEEINPNKVPDACFLPDGHPQKITSYKLNSLGISPYQKNYASVCNESLPDSIDLTKPNNVSVQCPSSNSDIYVPPSLPPQLPIIIPVLVAICLVLFLAVVGGIVYARKNDYKILEESEEEEEEQEAKEEEKADEIEMDQ